MANVQIEHHPTIGDIISNKYLKVMSKILKKWHLPTPGQTTALYDRKSTALRRLFFPLKLLAAPLRRYAWKIGQWHGKWWKAQVTTNAGTSYSIVVLIYFLYKYKYVHKYKYKNIITYIQYIHIYIYICIDSVCGCGCVDFDIDMLP